MVVIFNSLNKIAAVLAVLFLLYGCMITTEIIKEDGSVIIIKSKPDALVEYKEGGKEYRVDNRGKAGILEDIMKIFN
jgi:hypothetical protein